MGKHSICVTGVCDNDRRYPEQHKKHNVDGDIVMHKLPTERAVTAAWINAILKGRTGNSRKSSCFCNWIPAWLIN